MRQEGEEELARSSQALGWSGLAAIAWLVGNTEAFRPEVRHTLQEMALRDGECDVRLLRGIFAGWLIAFMVWLLPFAESAGVAVIVGITWLVGVGEFTHILKEPLLQGLRKGIALVACSACGHYFLGTG